jgi:hypothetical protein
MSRYYDRDGAPMTLLEWADRLEDVVYKRVAETTLPDGKWVSTAWLGLDHQHGDGPPLIFETMIFSSDKSGSEEVDCVRYSTLAEAEAGHAALVAKYSEPRA